MKTLLQILFITTIGLFLNSCGNNSTEENKQKQVTEEKTLTSADVIRSGNADGNRFFTTVMGDTLFGGKIFYNTHTFKGGYCVVSQKVNGKKINGVINLKGEEVIPIKYKESINDYDNGYFRIYRENSGYGYIDTTGKVVVEPIYSKVNSVRDNLVKVRNNNFKWGIIDLKGNEVAPFKYDIIGRWSNNLAVVKKNGKYGYINKKGEEIIPVQYNLALTFENGMALVKKNGKIGFINTSNKILIDFKYDDYKTIVDVYKSDMTLSGYEQDNKRFSMQEGYIVLKRGGKWGYINQKEEIIIPFEYDNIGVPAKGSDRVNIVKDNKKGVYYINKQKESLFN